MAEYTYEIGIGKDYNNIHDMMINVPPNSGDTYNLKMDDQDGSMELVIKIL